MHHRHRLGMRKVPWSMAFHSSIRPSVRVSTVSSGVGACPTDALLDSSPVFVLARPWHWFLPDPFTLWRLWLCVLGNYLAPGWNLVPQHLRKVLQLAGGLHLDTSHLLGSACQWLANPFGYPEKCCPKTLRTNLGINRIPWLCTRLNALQAFSTPLHVDRTWIRESVTRLWRVQDYSGATANPVGSVQNQVWMVLLCKNWPTCWTSAC